MKKAYKTIPSGAISKERNKKTAQALSIGKPVYIKHQYRWKPLNQIMNRQNCEK
jgi:hypothetical protein